MRIALYVIEKPLDTPGFIGGVFVRVKISLTNSGYKTVSLFSHWSIHCNFYYECNGNWLCNWYFSETKMDFCILFLFFLYVIGISIIILLARTYLKIVKLIQRMH